MTSKITRALVATVAATSLSLAPALTPVAHAAPVTIVAKAGQRGGTVATIQANLHKLGFLKVSPTGYYGAKTTAAVKAFQKWNGNTQTGVVDMRTYNLLGQLAAKRKAPAPVRVAKPAPRPVPSRLDAVIVARPGDRGATVKAIQTRLVRLGLLPSSSIVGIYGPQTTAAVKAFQRKAQLPVTGIVSERTRRMMNSTAFLPKAAPRRAVSLDRRCMTGRTICIDKTRLRMYWVVDGKVLDDWSVRVGRPSLPTREGTFHVYKKATNWWSTLYHVNMPYTQFFSGGEAVHYSVDFARNGYAGGGSHGCVNMRDKAGAAWLYQQTRIGDKVVVYRS